MDCSVDLLFLLGCVRDRERMLGATFTEATVGVSGREIIEEEVEVTLPAITADIVIDFGALEGRLVVLDSDVEDAVVGLSEA